jgi:hypothetical protein
LKGGWLFDQGHKRMGRHTNDDEIGAASFKELGREPDAGAGSDNGLAIGDLPTEGSEDR